MVARLTERIVDLLLSRFEADLAGKLTALEALYADGIELKEPLHTFAAPRPLGAPREYPSLFVWGTGMTNDPGYMLSQMIGNHTIRIAIAVKGQDRERQQRSLYRYADAILQIIDEQSQDEDETWALGGAIGVEYEELEEAAGETVQSVVVEAVFEHAEAL